MGIIMEKSLGEVMLLVRKEVLTIGMWDGMRMKQITIIMATWMISWFGIML